MPPIKIDGGVGIKKSEEAKVQWGTICECLPWEEREQEENLRSEMWSLFNISDSKTLTIFELESGVMRVTQSEELFDCLPAVRAAFHFTKVFFNNGVDEEEEAEKKAKEEQENSKSNEEVEVIKAPIQKVEKTLEFFEFRLFLQTLRQYYLYCQLFHNDDVNPKKTIKKKRFLKEENINEIRHWVGNNEELDWEAEFDQIDDDKDGKITFEIFVRWAFQRNMKLQLEKLEGKLQDQSNDDEKEENGQDGPCEE